MNYKLLLTIVALGLLGGCSEDETPELNVDDRVKFIGEWQCAETIGSSSSTFDIVISSYGESDSLQISNFSLLGSSDDALALVSGKSIVIPNQQIGVVVVQGSGLYFTQGGAEKMNLNYTVDGQSATAVCTKQ